MNNSTDTFWSRAIIHVDMNAFFASVEQLDQPLLRNKPVAVTNGLKGSCIITCSYEARAFGIKAGMRLQEARQLCPQLIRCPSRPKRYSEISSKIMHSLYNITPDVEVYSVDEAFLDVTHCQLLHGDPVTMGDMVKKTVWETVSLPCSIGISGDKTTAKYAAKLTKPDGFTVIPPWEAKARLSEVPVTELCGIAYGIGRFLAQYDVYTCGDMQRLAISILARRFGNIGRRIWYMCQGADPEPVHTKIPAPKSMGHGKVLPPGTKDKETLLTYLLHMSEKLAARLRKHQLGAQYFFIGLRTYDHGWLGNKIKLEYPTDDGYTLYRACQAMLNNYWQGEIIRQVQISALDPHPFMLQPDLFGNPQLMRQDLHKVIDEINARFGEFKIAPARLINRSDMPNVISPAWKPDGHRQTIE